MGTQAQPPEASAALLPSLWPLGLSLSWLSMSFLLIGFTLYPGSFQCRVFAFSAPFTLESQPCFPGVASSYTSFQASSWKSLHPQAASSREPHTLPYGHRFLDVGPYS